MVGFHFFEGCVGVIVCSETVFGTFVGCFLLTGRNSANQLHQQGRDVQLHSMSHTYSLLSKLYPKM